MVDTGRGWLGISGSIPFISARVMRESRGLTDASTRRRAGPSPRVFADHSGGGLAIRLLRGSVTALFVDDVHQRQAVRVTANVLGEQPDVTDLAFGRESAAVLSEDHVRATPENASGWIRLDGPWVRSGAGDAAFLEGGGERVLVHQRSAGHVQEVRRFLHGPEHLIADHPPAHRCVGAAADQYVHLPDHLHEPLRLAPRVEEDRIWLGVGLY